MSGDYQQVSDGDMVCVCVAGGGGGSRGGILSVSTLSTGKVVRMGWWGGRGVNLNRLATDKIVGKHP